jgi:hypothetical protein
MRALDYLPRPMIICSPAGTPVAHSEVYGDNDVIVPCAHCGADVRIFRAWQPWLGHFSPLCLLCHLTHSVPDGPTC